MKVYDFKVEDRFGDEVSLSDYEGQVLLIVNTATQCGFTPQYDGLQDMYEKYADAGFVILDFPCNQFGHQAPGSGEEIASFCDARFGITFPQFAKINVNGDEAAPLFRYLQNEIEFQGFNPDHEITPTLVNMFEQTNPNYANEPDIKWNFTKFLIDREGNVVERFEPTTYMEDVEAAVKELL